VRGLSRSASVTTTLVELSFIAGHPFRRETNFQVFGAGQSVGYSRGIRDGGA
jgi:hypothetical protein